MIVAASLEVIQSRTLYRLAIFIGSFQWGSDGNVVRVILLAILV